MHDTSSATTNCFAKNLHLSLQLKKKQLCSTHLYIIHATYANENKHSNTQMWRSMATSTALYMLILNTCIWLYFRFFNAFYAFTYVHEVYFYL